MLKWNDAPKGAENLARYSHYSTRVQSLSIGKMNFCDEPFVAFFRQSCFFLLRFALIGPISNSSRADGPLLIIGENTMAKEIVKNYTESQEAELAAAGIIDNAKALEFAAKFGKDVRSIRAKAVRMGIYKAAEKVSKTGGKIESKEAIVSDIAAIVGKNLDGLEKAPKLVLQILREKLSA